MEQEEREEDESPEKRLGSEKLLGLPTPNGKSIFFLTPKDKICDEYNVHWRFLPLLHLPLTSLLCRYEDYLQNETTSATAEGPSLPYASPPPAAPSGRSMKSVLTPRSVGKFKFVHDHP